MGPIGRLSRAACMIAAAIAVQVAMSGIANAAEADAPRPQRLKVGETTIAFGGPNDYAAFPALVRTEGQLILRFNNQPLDVLRAAKVKHPHFGPAIVPTWAVSTDQGKTWTSTTQPVAFQGKVVDAPTMSLLPDGGVLSLHWGYKKGTTEREPFVIKTYRGTFAEDDATSRREPTFDKVYPHGICTLPDGSGVLMAAYKGASNHPTGVNIYRGDRLGQNWEQVGFVPSTPPFYFNESAIQAFPDGRVILVMRNDYDKKLANGAEPPPETNGNGTERNGYGYWMSQADSTDGGRTWSAPRQLPIWGHPPYLLKLKSGNLLMVYGHRRPPHSIRAILSHDDGRTWDTDSLTTLHTFAPSARHDHGYPIATQLDDGRVLVAYYGYTSDDTKIWDSPHGIFTTTISESE